MNKPHMATTDYWWHLNQLANIIKHESRFVIPERYMIFVSTILQLILDKFSSTLPSNSILYRARLNPIDLENSENETIPFPPDQMGTPPRTLSISGRINPEGIPYLYCAGELDTAGAELRPWKGSFLTIAEIQIEHDLSIVDLTIDCDDKDNALALFFYEFTDMFSKQWPPESKLNYLVTQFFSEHFKSNGFNGVKYKSVFNYGGNNYALFNNEDYKIKNTYVVETCELDYFFYKKKEHV